MMKLQITSALIVALAFTGRADASRHDDDEDEESESKEKEVASREDREDREDRDDAGASAGSSRPPRDRHPTPRSHVRGATRGHGWRSVKVAGGRA